MNQPDKVRFPSDHSDEQCDIRVWASWQFLHICVIHIHTRYIYIYRVYTTIYIYIYIQMIYQPEIISFRLAVVATCPQWPRCSTACAVEAKTRSLPQRISTVSMSLLPCNQQECETIWEEGRRFACGEKGEEGQKAEAWERWTWKDKQKKEETWCEQCRSFHVQEAKKKQVIYRAIRIFGSFWSLGWIADIEQSNVLELPTPEGTRRSPVKAPAGLVQFWTHPCQC